MRNLIIVSFLTFTVASFAKTTPCEITPTPDSDVEVFSTFTLHFSDPEVKFDVVTFLDKDRPGEPGRDWNYNSQGHNDTVPALLLTNIDCKEGRKEFKCLIPAQIQPSSGEGISFSCPLTSEFLPPYNEPGEYLLTIDNLYKMVDGRKVNLDPITANYSIRYPYQFVLEPAVDDAKNLQGMTLTFPNLLVDYFQNNRVTTVSLEGPRNNYECDRPSIVHTPEGGSVLTFMFKDAQDSNEVFPEYITAAGDYYLTVRMLYIAGEYIDIPWIYKRYTLDGTGTPTATEMQPASIINPASPFVAEITGLQLSWGGTTLQLASPSEDLNEQEVQYSLVPALVKPELSETVYEVFPYLWADRSSGNLNSLLLDFTALADEFSGTLPYGSYQISLPGGIVKNASGLVNPEQQFELNKVLTDEEGPEVTPPMRHSNFTPYEYTASDLESVMVTWNGLLKHIEGAAEATVGENSMEALPAIPAPFDSETIYMARDSKALIVNLSTLPNGNWEVTIPEAYVLIYPAAEAQDEASPVYINNEVTLQYTIVDNPKSGAALIGADAEGLFNVYTLSGVHIVTSKSLSEVLALPRGVYVINGRTTLLR